MDLGSDLLRIVELGMISLGTGKGILEVSEARTTLCHKDDHLHDAPSKYGLVTQETAPMVCIPSSSS